MNLWSRVLQGPRWPQLHTAGKAAGPVRSHSQWSFTHKLKLNPDKSEVIWLGSRQQLAKLSEADKSLQLPDGLVRSSTTVKNLDVVIDERLSFDDQARSCIKSCYFHLRRLKQLRRYVEPDVIRSLVHAFVTSHLDYCNGLLAGCNAYTVVRRLQRLQNTAARLVLDVPHSIAGVSHYLENCIGCLSRAASSSNCVF